MTADTTPLLVAIIDDDPDVLDAVAATFKDTGRIFFQKYSTAEDFLRDIENPAMVPAPRPTCLLVDVGLPGISGLELQRLLKKTEVDVPVIFMTGQAEVDDAVEAMRRGAFDYLEKPFDTKEIVARVEAASQDYLRVAENQERIRQFRVRVDELTDREREVANALVRGETPKEIAYRLEVSSQAIHAHRGRVFKKLGIERLASLVRAYYEAGLLSNWKSGEEE